MAGIVLDVKRPVADSSARAARDQPRRHALSDLGAKPGVMRSGAAIQGSKEMHLYTCTSMSFIQLHFYMRYTQIYLIWVLGKEACLFTMVGMSPL